MFGVAVVYCVIDRCTVFLDKNGEGRSVFGDVGFVKSSIVTVSGAKIAFRWYSPFPSENECPERKS